MSVLVPGLSITDDEFATIVKLRLEQLEGIGFLAIIGSLVLVSVETRNSTKSTELNTQALEIAAYQELINNISEMNSLALQSEDAAISCGLSMCQIVGVRAYPEIAASLCSSQ